MVPDPDLVPIMPICTFVDGDVIFPNLDPCARQTCWEGYLSDAAGSGVTSVKCPEYQCGTVLSRASQAHLCTPDVFARLQRYTFVRHAPQARVHLPTHPHTCAHMRTRTHLCPCLFWRKYQIHTQV